MPELDDIDTHIPEVPDYADLNERNARLEANLDRLTDRFRTTCTKWNEERDRLVKALENIISMTEEQQGDWLPVDNIYLPLGMLPYRRIERIARAALAEIDPKPLQS